ncbi:hypothetical protein GQ600_15310 [Phytophthora cactorum]|nr:hypothetical protein GQ600_15310 [Phytophthora cactorum]
MNSVLTTEERPWDSSRKYREALSVATAIWDAMAGLGMPQYREVMKQQRKCTKRRVRASSGDSISQSGNSGTQLGQLAPADGRSFDVSSPPKSRGRPKRITKAKKAARNKIIGYGGYSIEAISIVTKRHRAMKAIKHVEKTITWVQTIDFTFPAPISFQVSADSGFLVKVKSPPLLSPKTEVLDLVGRGPLSDATVDIVMPRLFEARAHVLVISPNVIGPVVDGSLSAPLSDLIPMYCNYQHWCSIMQDMAI